MFGLGMTEIGVIIVLAVMLFPPKELPKLARMIARAYGQLRRTAEDFRASVLEDEDLREPIDEIKGAYNDARWEIRDAERKARQQLAKAQMEMRMATARRIQAEREAEAKPGDETTHTGANEGGPVRVAAGSADDEDDDETGDGPVAGNDPRTLARSHLSPAPTSDDRGNEPREGVA